MSVNPEVANALRDISNRIGDFDAAIADFQYTPSAPEPAEEPSGRAAAGLGRILTVALMVGAGAAGVLAVGPTILSWIEPPEQPAALAFTEPDGEPTQRFVVDGDTMYLEGAVPDQETSDVLESAAVAAVGRDRVVNNFEISDDAFYDADEPIHLSLARPVLFRTGAANLDSAYGTLIELAVDLMKAEPASTLLVVGHTDDVGPDDANLRLSFDRAQAVADRVIEHGIEPDRLTIEGRGEAEPLESNDTDEGRAINRRVEFSILGVFGR